LILCDLQANNSGKKSLLDLFFLTRWAIHRNSWGGREPEDQEVLRTAGREAGATPFDADGATPFDAGEKCGIGVQSTSGGGR
jgi:hypothetical protein